MARQKMLFRNNYVSLTKSRYTHSHRHIHKHPSVTQAANKNERAHTRTQSHTGTQLHTQTEWTERETNVHTHILSRNNFNQLFAWAARQKYVQKKSNKRHTRPQTTCRPPPLTTKTTAHELCIWNREKEREWESAGFGLLSVYWCWWSCGEKLR